MTDIEQTQHTEDVDNEGGDDSSVIRTLRKQLKEQSEELKALQSFKRTTAFREAGFDPESGQGKALARTFEGDPTPEAIREFAKNEYGWEVPDAGSAPSERTEAETQREQSQQRADKVNASSTSVPPPDDMQTQIATAEQAGDWQRAAALKSQVLNSTFYPNRQ